MRRDAQKMTRSPQEERGSRLRLQALKIYDFKQLRSAGAFSLSSWLMSHNLNLDLRMMCVVYCAYVLQAAHVQTGDDLRPS